MAGQRSIKRFRAVATVVAGASLLLSYLVVPALATTGGFEIDGDFLKTTGTYDWSNAPNLVTTVDDPLPSDWVFGTGSNKEEHDPSSWSFVKGTASPSKSDLVRGHVASSISAASAHLWLGYERLEINGVGDAHVDFELNQSAGTWDNVNGTLSLTRSQGDLLVVYDFDGGTGFTIEVWTWDATNAQWDKVTAPVLDTEGAVNTVPVLNLSNELVAAENFGETSIDLDTLIQATATAGTCGDFSSVWVKSRNSHSINAELIDFIPPQSVDVTTCGSITVEKQDEDGNKLSGFTFTAYRDADDSDTVNTGDTVFGTCTTTAPTGRCTVQDVPISDYVVAETGAPAGYVIDGDEVGVRQSLRDIVTPETNGALVWVNPRVPYRIDVTPTGTNPVGTEHDFTVTVEQDVDPTGATDWQPVADSTAVALSWTGGVGYINEIVDDDGTAAYTVGNQPTSCSTSTGTCTITVYSDDPGASDLNATFTTPYQHASGAATNPANETDSAASITESATKTWKGYVVTIEGPAVNPLGESHAFDITVKESDGTTETAANGVTVDLSWSGPTGSTLEGDANGPWQCVTNGQGICTVTVDSDANPGEGTLGVTSASGTIASQALTQTVTGVSTTKTWVDYRVTIDGNSVNPAAEEHTFNLTVEQNDGTGWAPVPEGTTLDLDWSGTGAIVTDGDTCSVGGTTAGECSVTVSSDDMGTGKLTVDGIANVELTDTEDIAYDLDPDVEATKTWVEYEISVSASATNRLDEPHTFDVTAQRNDGAGWEDVPDGTTLALTWTGTGAPTADTCTTGGTVDGDCAVTVGSGTVGTGTLTLTGIADTELDGRQLDYTFPTSTTRTKTWVDFQVTITPDDATNPLSAPEHRFEVRVWRADHLDGGGEPVWEAWDATLTPQWSGEGTIDAETCSAGTVDGLCTVDVTTLLPGTGTLTVTAIDASLDGVVAAVTHDVDDVTGVKRWVNYRVRTSGDAVNRTGDPHTFTVWVESNDGTRDAFNEPVWGPVAGATLAPTWQGPDGGDTVVSETCSVGTLADGSCLVVVASTIAGSGTLTVNEITVAVQSTPIVVDVTDASATKTWRTPSIGLTKTPDITGAEVGDTITYTYLVTNDGGDTLLAVTLVDDILGDIALDVATLAPGESTTATATHDVTEADLPGPVVNEAVTAGTPSLGGDDVTASDTASVSLTSEPGIDVTKSADLEPDAEGLKIVRFDPADGDDETVTYTYFVTNIGDVTLAEVALVDDVLGPITLPVDTLDPGESVTVTAAHVVTADDLSAGTIVNVATGSGTGPDGTEVEDDATETVHVAAALPFVVDREPPPAAPDPPPAAAPTQLPRTGGDNLRLFALALLLVVAGTWTIAAGEGPNERRYRFRA